MLWKSGGLEPNDIMLKSKRNRTCFFEKNVYCIIGFADLADYRNQPIEKLSPPKVSNLFEVVEIVEFPMAILEMLYRNLNLI